MFNLATAWYRWPLSEEYRLAGVYASSPEMYEGRWRGMHHGVGLVSGMRACGCPICWERADQLEASERREPVPWPVKPPRVVDVAPVRAHVRRLLEAGMSRRGIASAAGVDMTTVCRLLRDDVRRVRAETSSALLAVTV